MDIGGGLWPLISKLIISMTSKLGANRLREGYHQRLIDNKITF